MTIDPAVVLITVGPLAAGALVWLIRLEGRINTNESMTEKLAADITYIRQRIDAALNGFHRD